MAALRYPRSFLGLAGRGFLLVAAAAGRRAAVFGLAHRAPGRAEPQRGVGASQAARASRALVEPHRLDRAAGAAGRGAARCASCAPTSRALHARLPQVVGRARAAAARRRAARRAQPHHRAGAGALRPAVAGAPRTRSDARAVRGTAAELAESAYEVLAISYCVADREVERLRASAEEVQRRLIAAGAVATARWRSPSRWR